MYSILRNPLLRLVKAPTDAPEAPAGSHDSVRVFRAHPNFLRYSLLSLVIVSTLSYAIPTALIIIGVVENEGPPLIMGFVVIPLFALIQFCLYFAVRIDYDMRYYIVTDRSLRVREGALVVKEKTITFANVQNLRLVQGPLLRLFGIWHLQVETAGGGAASEQGQKQANQHTVRLAGIDNAHSVRDLILGHLKTLGRDSGLGDPDDEDSGGGSRQLSPVALVALRELCTACSALRTAAEKRSTG